ncbi:hypothetical protein K7432_013855 [Basidiobolus ranarum]|uniref:Major facilitator superfamily (MFS) profile domain-containing protein n=1 Tax=Basidiobolus ranarum TaxID=34480 RepID=A0ABR2VQE3_9FUNG
MSDSDSIAKVRPEEHTVKTHVENEELAGVKKGLVVKWRNADKYIVVGSLFAINFVTAMDTSATATIMPKVLSEYNSLTMYGALTSVSYLLVAGIRPIFAKIADTFGRVHAIGLSILFHTIGFVICASARNFGYIFAGTLLSTIGQAGYSTISVILIADFIPLYLRGSFNGYMAIPSVTNAYLGPVVAYALLIKWRWVYGLLAILALVCSIPAVYSLYTIDKRASEDLQKLENPPPRKPLGSLLLDIAIELDILGLLLLCGGVIMVLLPLGLSYNTIYGWGDGRVLGPLISGIIVILLFIIYEHKYARYPVVPFRLFKNKTFSAAMAAGVMFYFTSNVSLFFFNAFIQVTRDTDARTAQLLQLGYVVYYIGVILGGWAMQKSKRYRRWAWVGWAIYLIAVGLMIRTRGGTHTSNAEIAIVQGLLGLGSGVAIGCIGIGVQASVVKADIAIAVALYLMVAYLGGAIGEATSTTIWNTTLPNRLMGQMDPSVDVSKAINNIDYFKTLPIGQKELVQLAYIDTQKILSICGVGALVLAGFAMLFLAPYDLSEDQNEREVEESG